MHKPARTFFDPRSKDRQQKDHKDSAQKAKEIREHLTEEQIDKMLKDSFPASDLPGTY